MTIKIKNHIAFDGDAVIIIRAPPAAPIHAPNTGMSAVTVIRDAVIKAYGKENTVIPTKHSPPSMNASVTCPEI